jgi:ABC-type cobalt transport system, permease component CbiQ and related transporters
LHPLSKLVALLALSGAITTARCYLLPGLITLSIGALASAGVFRQGIGKGARDICRDLRFLVPLTMIVIAFIILDPMSTAVVRFDKLPTALSYIARLIGLFVLAEAFYRSTSAEGIAAAITLAFRRATGREDIDPGLYLSLTLCFIPRCFQSYSRVREAAVARGYGGKRGRPRFRSSRLVLESFIAGSITAALRTVEAMEARCYSPGRSLPKHSFRRADAILVIASVALASGFGLAP